MAMSGRNSRLETRREEGEAQRRPPDGIQALREACLTMNATEASVIRSMTVIVGLDELPVGPSSALDLVERIAGEFGLDGQAQISRYRLVARISRLEPLIVVGTPDWRARKSRFRAVVQWLGLTKSDRADRPTHISRSGEKSR
jgi:hypothetical protein